MWRAKPLTVIELRHLRYFLAAAERGSFRKAGILLNVEASSISRRVQDLEDRLGVSLFKRHNSGVDLTLAGRQLFLQAQIAMKHLGDGAKDAHAIGRSENRQLRVGLFPSLASSFLYELIQEYVSGSPGVDINFRDGGTTEHIAAVRMNQLDVAFIAGTAQYVGCETVHLWSEAMFLALPSAHRLADRRSLVWSDLVGEVFIVSDEATGQHIERFLASRLSYLGHKPEIDRQNVGRHSLIALVAIGRGLMLTSEAAISTISQGVIYRRIEGEVLPFSAVWARTNHNPALHSLLSLARHRSKSK